MSQLFYILVGAAALFFISSAAFSFLKKNKWLSVILFALGALGAAAARIQLVRFAVDSGTGFSTNDFASYLFIGLVALALLSLVAYKFAGGRKNIVISSAPFIVDFAVNLFAAAGFVYFSIYAFKHLDVNGKLSGLMLVTLFASAISVIVFIYALPVFKKFHLKAASTVFLIPVLAIALFLISGFIERITVASVSEYLIDVLMIVFVMLMLFMLAKYKDMQKTAPALSALSLGAFLFILISCAPKFLFGYFDFGPVFTENWSEIFAGFALLLPLALRYSFKKTQKEETVKEDEPLPEIVLPESEKESPSEIVLPESEQESLPKIVLAESEQEPLPEIISPESDQEENDQ